MSHSVGELLSGSDMNHVEGVKQDINKSIIFTAFPHSLFSPHLPAPVLTGHTLHV